MTQLNTKNINIKVGDIVRLNQPYEVNDPGFQIEMTHGIVHQILNRNLSGEPHKLALYLYGEDMGVSSLYILPDMIPQAVDFLASEVTLIFKSSAKNIRDGYVV